MKSYVYFPGSTTIIVLLSIVVVVQSNNNCDEWPKTCPGTFPRSPYKQTWLMNLSTIILIN